MIRIYVFSLSPTWDGPVKIGMSQNVQSRLGQIRNGCPYPVYLIDHCIGSKELEQEFHRRCRHARIRGEWFDGTDKEVNSCVCEIIDSREEELDDEYDLALARVFSQGEDAQDRFFGRNV